MHIVTSAHQATQKNGFVQICASIASRYVEDDTARQTAAVFGPLDEAAYARYRQ